VAPEQLDALAGRTGGQWLSCEEAVASPAVSPSSLAVFARLRADAGALLPRPADRPTMDGLALRWLSQNREGVRFLPKQTLHRILDAGGRAFNLRVADPYLRYQMQGVGFTWSFFTARDAQDIHVHGAPVVEIYGVLEGEMEIWWKPYYDRGTSAWCHRILGPGDWIEVDSLQCHIVHWLEKEGEAGRGKGVVFKAGPGPLVGVGRLGEKGKTSCKDCPCMKPPEVLALEGRLAHK
jgi:mannose-6-phosphate isomerase-like protein (cupin superfamily)